MHCNATHALFGQVDKLLKLARRQVFGDHDATACVLLLRRDADGAIARTRMTDVSRQLGISKPAATQMVARLVERGLVERVSDESDRRVVSVQATERGLATMGASMEEALGLIDRVVIRMGERDADVLAALMERFLDAMVAETEENK